MPLTPAFEASVHGSRRDEVLRRMREMAPGPAVAIFPATPVATRNSDVEHPYRAHSDVYWLTGFEEPEAVVIKYPSRSSFVLTKASIVSPLAA